MTGWALVWSAGLDQLMWSDARPARDLGSECFLSLRGLQSVSPQVEELQRRANHLRDLFGGQQADVHGSSCGNGDGVWTEVRHRQKAPIRSDW